MDENNRTKLVEDFLLDPQRVIFEQLLAFKEASDTLIPLLQDVDLAALKTLKGEDGVTPVRGVDYFTDEDLDTFETFIIDKMPKVDIDFPSIAKVQEFITSNVAEQVSQIKRVKGDKGDPGEPGKNGSPDSGLDIIKKIQSVKDKNKKLQLDDIRGLNSKIDLLNELVDDFEELKNAFENSTITMPANMSGGSSGIENIAGYIEAGTNVTLDGSGTLVDPYVINAVGGGGGVESITGDMSIDVDNTDPLNPIITLLNDEDAPGNSQYYGTDGSGNKGFHSFPSGGAVAFADLTGDPYDNTALAAALNAKVENLGDLGITATAAELNILDGATLTTTELNFVDGVTSSIQTQLDSKYAASNPSNYLDAAGVRGTALTGLSITGSAIVSTDTILQALGKAQNQINALIGGVNYQGSWNANTNSPSLASGVGTKGYYYVVSTPGATNLDGITDWKLGDWAIFNGTVWEKIDNTDAVVSVNGYTGIVTLAKADVGLGNVDNTSNATERAAAATLTNKTIALGSNSLSGTLAQFNTAVTDADLASLAGTETLTNKRITKRIGTTASSATPTPDADANDQYNVTALAAGATFGAPSGTPTDGQTLVIRIKDNGTARTLAFNAIYRAVGVTLPTTTVISKTLYLGMFYNAADSKWDVTAVAQEA